MKAVYAAGADPEAAVDLDAVHCNFLWRPGTMRIMPAMVAGITGRLWIFDQLMAG